MKARSTPQIVISALGAGAVLLALLPALGWITAYRPLLSFLEISTPTRFNAVLALLFSGAALLALGAGRRRITLVLAVVTVLIGSLTLLEYVAGVNLGIDSLVVGRSPVLGVHPARMSPGSAFGFTAFGAAVILAAVSRSRHLHWVLALAGTVVSGLGVAAIAGYAANLSFYFQWEPITAISVPTSGGFLLLGLALIAAAWNQVSGRAIPYWLRFVVPLELAVLFLALYRAWQIHEGGATSAAPGGYADEVAVAVGLLLALAAGVLISNMSARKQREEELARAKQDWERTFDAVPDLISIMDTNFRILRANKAMARALERTPAECRNLACYPAMHGTDYPPDYCPMTCTLRDGKEHLMQVRPERLGGTFIVTTSPLFDATGQLTGAVHVARDIAELKTMEDQLRESKATLERAQAVAHVGSWRLDLRSNELAWSEETHRIFGLPIGTPLTYETFLAVVHPDDRAYVDQCWREALQGAPYNLEHRIVVGGETRWVREIAELELDRGGNPERGIGTVQDITEPRRRQEQTQRLNRALRMTSDCNQVLVRATNERDLLQEICRVIVEVGGYRMAWVGYAEKGEGKAVRPVAQAGFEDGYLQTANVTWADRERGQGPTGTAVRTGQASIIRNTALDLSFAPWKAEALKRGYASVMGVPLFAGTEVIGALTLYSARVDSFDEEEAGLLKELANDLSVGIFSLRAQAGRARAEQVQQCVYRISEAANSAATLEELFPSIHAIVGELIPARNLYIAQYDASAGVLSFPYFVDECDPPPAPKQLGKGLTEYVIRSGKPLLASPAVVAGLVRAGEAEVIGTDSLDWLGVPLKARGDTFGVLVVQSYTEGVRYGEEDENVLTFVSEQIAMAIQRKRAEEALRRSEEEYRRFFDSNLAGNFVKRPDGTLLTCNPAFMRMFGLSSLEEAQQMSMSLLYPTAEQRGRFLELLKKHGRLENHEQEMRRRDGRRMFVIENVVGVFDEHGELKEIQGFLIDDTERRMAEEQLRQVQKMEAIGQLSGGIAHDFNNLLNVIMGYGELLQDDIGTEDPRRKRVEQIIRAAQKATALTRQLLAFSRKQVMEPKVMGLNSVVGDAEKMLRRLIGENIELITTLRAADDTVKIDPGQMEQVILNLAVNARDAMPRGGRLTIETAEFTMDDVYHQAHVPATVGPYVMLAVSDTGTGMDASVRAHIFEPFFTTKEKGKGTGLGLSTVYGIVKQSGGYIWVYSEPGHGSTFKIYLPQVTGVVQPRVPAQAVPIAPTGEETVLVVEDDEGLREFACECLRKCGYKVLSAGTGTEALALDNLAAVHLLITDVVMPGMSGRDLAARLTETFPQMKVLYVSGYTDGTALDDKLLDRTSAFLQKPYGSTDLASKARALLHGSLESPAGAQGGAEPGV